MGSLESRKPAFWDQGNLGELIEANDVGEVYGFNEDGSLSVGEFIFPGKTWGEGFLCDAATGVLSNLGSLDSNWEGNAADFSEDGNIIVGGGFDPEGAPFFTGGFILVQSDIPANPWTVLGGCSAGLQGVPSVRPVFSIRLPNREDWRKLTRDIGRDDPIQRANLAATSRRIGSAVHTRRTSTVNSCRGDANQATRE